MCVCVCVYIHKNFLKTLIDRFKLQDHSKMPITYFPPNHHLTSI